MITAQNPKGLGYGRYWPPDSLEGDPDSLLDGIYDCGDRRERHCHDIFRDKDLGIQSQWLTIWVHSVWEEMPKADGDSIVEAYVRSDGVRVVKMWMMPGNPSPVGVIAP